jgi:hypothetical protein
MAQSEVIPALARVVRGLSALFWGLPLVVLLDTKTALNDSWQSWGFFPVLFAAGLLLFGLFELRQFQPHERIWISALERAQVVGLILLALAPVTFWWNRMPAEPFFLGGILLLLVAGLTFLLALNQVMLRLAAMLPDETLRSETRFFVRWNRFFLGLLGLLLGAYFALLRTPVLPDFLVPVVMVFEWVKTWLILILALLPVSLTMTLLWKTKEVIVVSVFRPAGPPN